MRISCKAVAEREGGVAVVEDAVLHKAVVNVAVHVETVAHGAASAKRCHGDEGYASRQSSWKRVMPTSTQSRSRM